MTMSSADVAEQLQRAALGRVDRPGAGRRADQSERQALEALLLPSANNIALLLAVHDEGGRKAFLARMNSRRARLGMSATTYTDPSGFDASTVSTATDQLKLARVVDATSCLRRDRRRAFGRAARGGPGGQHQ